MAYIGAFGRIVTAGTNIKIKKSFKKFVMTAKNV